MHSLWTKHEIETLTTFYHLRMTKELVDLLPGRTLDSIFQKARSLNLKANRKRTRKQYRVNYGYFSVPDLENSYWAGFIAADGNVRDSKDSIRIKLSGSDSQHLEAFKRYCGSTSPVRDSYNGLKKYASLEIHGVPQWRDDLRKNFNITPRKSLTLQPPNHLSLKQSLAFIAGYIDGDGCIFKEQPPTGHLRLGVQITGTYEILCWIKALFDKIAPSEYQASVRCVGRVYSYKIVGKKAELILEALLQIATPKLERKWAKVSTFLQRKQVEYVRMLSN